MRELWDWRSHKVCRFHLRTRVPAWRCYEYRKRLQRLPGSPLARSQDSLQVHAETEKTVQSTQSNAVYIQGGSLRYRLNKTDTAQTKCRPFPSHLTANKEHKEAALAHNSRTTVVALLGRLTRSFSLLGQLKTFGIRQELIY